MFFYRRSAGRWLTTSQGSFGNRKSAGPVTGDSFSETSEARCKTAGAISRTSIGRWTAHCPTFWVADIRSWLFGRATEGACKQQVSRPSSKPSVKNKAVHRRGAATPSRQAPDKPPDKHQSPTDKPQTTPQTSPKQAQTRPSHPRTVPRTSPRQARNKHRATPRQADRQLPDKPRLCQRPVHGFCS